MAVVCAKSASFATHPVAVLLSGTCAPTGQQPSPDFELSSKVELTSWGLRPFNGWWRYRRDRWKRA